MRPSISIGIIVAVENERAIAWVDGRGQQPGERLSYKSPCGPDTRVKHVQAPVLQLEHRPVLQEHPEKTHPCNIKSVTGANAHVSEISAEQTLAKKPAADPAEFLPIFSGSMIKNDRFSPELYPDVLHFVESCDVQEQRGETLYHTGDCERPGIVCFYPRILRTISSTAAFARGSSPQTGTARSSGSVSAFHLFAATVLNAEQSLVSGGAVF